MNQAQLEPGILCHEYMLHKPSIFQHKPPFFRLQSTIQFIKTKDKTLFCLYISTPKMYLQVRLRTFHILNRHSALHLKRIFCLPDAWPREICRVPLFVCLRARVYDMFTKYLFIMQRSGSVLAGLGGKWRVLFVSLAVSGGCFAQIQGGN